MRENSKSYVAVSSVGLFCGLVTGDDFSVDSFEGDKVSVAPTNAPKSPVLPEFFTGLISESPSLPLSALKFAQPSEVCDGDGFGPGEDSKGLSNGTVVEAAKGFESQGFPMSIATSVPEPDSTTSVEEFSLWFSEAHSVKLDIIT